MTTTPAAPPRIVYFGVFDKASGACLASGACESQDLSLQWAPPGAVLLETPGAIVDPATVRWSGKAVVDAGPPPPPPMTWTTVRATRDALLDASDWTQLGDAPAGVPAAWRAYRQALRDITTAFATPAAVVWPLSPLETKP